MTQSPQYQQDISDNETIPRTKKSQLNEMKSSGTISSGSPTSVYMGQKKPPITAVVTKRVVLPLKILAKQVLSVRRANTLDFSFLKEVTGQDSCPEFGGFSVKLARNEGTEQRASTKTMYQPLIDAKPSDQSTIKTAME
jgi:GMP synthase-like glutamine amidotransferase